jgi:aspartate racemase
MEQEFYKSLLTEQYGLHVLVPPSDDRAIVHRIIYDELCLGVIKPESKAEYVRIMSQLGQAGAEAIILGCTEIELLIKDEDSELPLFDTTKLHAKAAVDYALAGA